MPCAGWAKKWRIDSSCKALPRKMNWWWLLSNLWWKMCFHHCCAAGCTTAYLKSGWLSIQHGYVDLHWRIKIDLEIFWILFYLWALDKRWGFSFSLSLLLAVGERGWDGVYLPYLGAESGRIQRYLNPAIHVLTLVEAQSAMEIQGYTVIGALWEYIRNQDFRKCLGILKSQTSGIYPEKT